MSPPALWLETLANHLPGLVYRCRNDATYTMASLAGGCRELTGYGIEAFLGGPARVAYVDLIHPDDREYVRTAIDAAAREHEPFTLEYRIRTADGQAKWVWERGLALESDGEGADWLQGFIIDITERKSAEQHLAERVKELRCLHALDALLDREPELQRALTRFLEHLPAAFQHPEELGARLFLEGATFTTAGFQATACAMSHPVVVEEEVIGRLEVAHQGQAPLSPTAYFLDEERHLLGAVARRIGSASARVRIQEALRASESRARALYEHLPLATFVWQHQNGEFVLIQCNASADRLSGGDGRRSIGLTADVVFGDTPEMAKDLEVCFSTHRVVERELRHRLAKDLPERVLHIVWSFVPSDLVLAHVEDVTDRRRFEEGLRVAQRMEAVGQLAGGVAHDFNNLLTTINGYSDILLMQVGLRDSMREDLQAIRGAGERAAELTRRLLVLSRRQVMSPRRLDLSRLVRDFVSMVQRSLGGEVEVQLELPEGLPSVEVDPGQLEQVLLNLLLNSRDAMPKGGTIRVETSLVHLDELAARAVPEARPGDYVALAVADTGLGMDEDTRRRAFEPFFTTKDQGTGLGLATAYGIVTQSGGFLALESTDGSGTRVAVHLPCVEGAPDEVAPPSGLARPSGRTRTGSGQAVLIVDDDKDVRYAIRRMLEHTGYRAVDAGDLEEAMGAAEREPFDLLLVDVVLPGVGGSAIAERLRARHPDLRVVYMSGHSDELLARRGLLGRDLIYLTKPFTSVTLTRTLKRALEDA